MALNTSSPLVAVEAPTRDKTVVHIIYIHGFQGDDMSFQSFPTDLHNYLSPRLNDRFQLKSSLYPTYKCVKPLSFATNNFKEWLKTQPEGFVILVGHSMGGLLAADAAVDPSQKGRIVAVLAFDTPFLGMHPHVVVSGIASLFPKDKGGSPNNDVPKQPTVKEMNDPNRVTMVDEAVTDDWEEFKKTIHRPNYPPSHSSSSVNPYRSHSSNKLPLASSPPSSISSSLSSLSLVSSHSASTSTPPSILSARTFASVTNSFMSTFSDEPLVRWARKHSDEPFKAAQRWAVEYFQFGICMFDPPGLKERYTRLIEWDGYWVNYWTETPASQKSNLPIRNEEYDALSNQETLENDIALLESGVTVSAEAENENASTVPGPRTKAEAKNVHREAAKSSRSREKEIKKAEMARGKELKRLEKEHSTAKPARHFSVIPRGLGRILGGSEKWEGVCVAGAENEVEAHCGLFIPTQNLDYGGLVERVGNRVLGWCQSLPKV